MSVDVQNFQEDVIEASSRVPVLVDFWAEWCGPCRVLGPVLEKLEADQEGKWILAKVDTDANPELSAQFGIRGIPAVKLFVDGRVVNEFTGALPEHAVRQWLEEAIPSESKAQLAHALELIKSGREEEGISMLESLETTDPGNPEIIVPLARLLFFKDRERALSLASALSDEPRYKLESDAIALFGELQDRKEEIEALDAEDGLNEYRKALSAVETGDAETAIAALIEVLQTNRYLDDDGARKMGIALFVILGDAHPLTKKYRRTFDMWLY